MKTVKSALQDFIERALAETDDGCFWTPFDADWRSPCELNNHREADEISWRPVPQASPVSFDGLANALEQPVHPDIYAYFGSFWGGSLEATTDAGHVSLIQLWNPADFDRLIENLVGHTLVQRRAKLDYTVFFATTDPDSELFLSIDNRTGRVMLEEPGKAPRRSVAANIATFLDQLTPATSSPGLH
ncbi:MAG: SecY-interacting protein [Pseudomonadales bacterium]|jgi:SecY interacting protein Syd|nr:SecY-interacting protein [Pseudomonadales bacterium]MDP4639589.1 SecY-interacting protein [Pseudomonadales bacterium]MDP4766735.1 SecY-interacting protein [Pseudomonadales bacterium]MDP4875837.1 SecY-interacting protein [Pseudomonadales bacterium]MDP4911754.1 SecY-interacting protein [Pseudomonadales bacterium]